MKSSAKPAKTYAANFLSGKRRLPDALGEALLALYFIPPLIEYFFLTSGEHLALRVLVYSLWLLPTVILCFYLGQRGTLIAAVGVLPFALWYGRGYLAEQSDYHGVLAAYYASVLFFAVFAGLLAESLKRRVEALQKKASDDPVSGLFNQQFFLRTLERELDRARRYKEPLSVVMMNIDNFRKYNEAWGTTQGDRALATAAKVLEKTLRNTDIIARYQEADFAIILPHTDLFHAKEVCARIERILKQTPVDSPDGGTPPLTASFGAALYQSGMSARQLVDDAGRILYLAKSEKNREK